MTSQTGQQTIIIPILPNISRRNGNQTMKFGQLVEYNLKLNFSPEIMQFLFHKKALYTVKASVKHLSFNIFW